MSKDRKTPQTLKTLDPRVFSEFSLVFYNSTTLDISHIIKRVPKGIDLLGMQESLDIGSTSVGLFRGEVPSGHRRKFVDGNIIVLMDPNLVLDLNTPFAVREPDGYLTPMVLNNETFVFTIRSVTEDGRVYKYIEDHPLRLNSTKGMLSQNHIGAFKGKYSIKWKSVGINCSERAHIKVESPHLRQTILEVFCTDGTLR
jgi:hypothetical protein